MKILALIGSPRKGGNTDTLVGHILKGWTSRGHTYEKLYLYDHEICPCADCRRCKRGDCVCTINDGMQEIYPKVEAADVIIFGTPIYWYGPTGKMKLLIDRLRPFIATGRLKGKRALIVAPSEEGPKACGPLIEMLRRSFDYLGMELAGRVLAKAYEKAEVAEDREELKRAYDLGASLGSSIG